MNAPMGGEGQRAAVRRWLESRTRITLAVAKRVVTADLLLKLATAAAVTGGVLLVVAEFLDLFQVRTVTGARSGDEQTGGDHHFYALLVMGMAVIGAMLLARTLAAWPPAAAVAALGTVALFITLAIDLPDASSAGLTEDLVRAEASPAAGLWMELAGALATLAGGTAAALLLRRGAGLHPAESTPEQRRRFGP